MNLVKLQGTKLMHRNCLHSYTLKMKDQKEKLRKHLEGWDSEGGRETQEGGDMGIYVYV